MKLMQSRSSETTIFVLEILPFNINVSQYSLNYLTVLGDLPLNQKIIPCHLRIVI